jgi:hypothetical protein
VIDRGESFFDSYLIAEIFEDIIVELLGIIDRYLFWYSKPADYVLTEESFEPCYSYID